VFGFKPTYGRLSRSGIGPFVPSFDHVGPLARSVTDIAAAYDAMQGDDPADPVACRRGAEPAQPGLTAGVQGLRMAQADGYFAAGMTAEAARAVALAVAALGITQTASIPTPDAARAAAYVITSVEGTSLQLPNLRDRPGDFDPATRDRHHYRADHTLCGAPFRRTHVTGGQSAGGSTVQHRPIHAAAQFDWPADPCCADPSGWQSSGKRAGHWRSFRGSRRAAGRAGIGAGRRHRHLKIPSPRRG
jgi:hypothetical protein